MADSSAKRGLTVLSVSQAFLEACGSHRGRGNERLAKLRKEFARGGRGWYLGQALEMPTGQE